MCFVRTEAKIKQTSINIKPNKATAQPKFVFFLKNTVSQEM